MHFLWIKSLIISYKNEPLLLSLGDCFEEKKWANKWSIIKKISGELRISFRTKF